MGEVFADRVYGAVFRSLRCGLCKRIRRPNLEVADGDQRWKRLCIRVDGLGGELKGLSSCVWGVSRSFCQVW